MNFNSDLCRLPVDHYVIEKQDARRQWVPVGKVSGGTTKLTANGLTSKEKYNFRVKAVNNEGKSEPLIASLALDVRYIMVSRVARRKPLNNNDIMALIESISAQDLKSPGNQDVLNQTQPSSLEKLWMEYRTLLTLLSLLSTGTVYFFKLSRALELSSTMSVEARDYLVASLVLMISAFLGLLSLLGFVLMGGAQIQHRFWKWHVIIFVFSWLLWFIGSLLKKV